MGGRVASSPDAPDAAPRLQCRTCESIPYLLCLHQSIDLGVLLLNAMRHNGSLVGNIMGKQC